MRLSNMADYAIVMMAATARHCGGARTSATQLSSETGIALPTVQKLVTLLSKAGLLKSVRGTGGGISLSRPSAAINLADIIEAIEGPIAMTSCVSESSAHCAIESSCHAKPHWAIVNKTVRKALADVSLDILCKAPMAHNNNAVETPLMDALL